KTYTYDANGQLTGDGTSTYSYDDNGNRNMSGYTVTTGNRISTDGTWNYGYDDEGNIVNKTKIVGGEYWTYSYDNDNRLVDVKKYTASSGGTLLLEVKFAYDALGNRIEKDVDANADGTFESITKFAYDENGNAWADLSSSGSLITRRLYADAVDALFARI